MRVVPRRSKDRQGSRSAEPARPEDQAAEPAPAEEPPAQERAIPEPPDAAAAPKPKRKERRRARKADKKASKKGAKKPADDDKPVPAAADPKSAAAMEAAALDAAQRRRARLSERQRTAAEVKRSRAAHRQGRSRQAKAAREHRSALLVMVLTLGLLIAAVAVTGGMVAASRQTRPVTLAAPLHIYPVAQATPGQCPAGTQGISGQAATGPTCYRLNQGIAIRKVADLRVQRTRAGGGYDVAVTLRSADQKAFAELTRAMVGKDLAFVVRDRLVTAPRVDMPILDGKVAITGAPNRPGADKIVRELKGR